MATYGYSWFRTTKEPDTPTTPTTPNTEAKHVPHDSGMSVSVLQDQSELVKELQEEVRMLAERRITDSQRFADYENEIRVLQAQVRQEKRKNLPPPPIDTSVQQQQQPPIARPQAPAISRFGSFIGNRTPVTPGSAISSANRERELEASLVAERTQRLAAERKVKEVTNEIEELSASLFQTANEMVSAERREKADLKELIKGFQERENKFTKRLEALEQREIERQRRMAKLESAIKRIERAKTLLLPR